MWTRDVDSWVFPGFLLTKVLLGVALQEGAMLTLDFFSPLCRVASKQLKGGGEVGGWVGD